MLARTSYPDKRIRGSRTRYRTSLSPGGDVYGRSFAQDCCSEKITVNHPEVWEHWLHDTCDTESCHVTLTKVYHRTRNHAFLGFPSQFPRSLNLQFIFRKPPSAFAETITRPRQSIKHRESLETLHRIFHKLEKRSDQPKPICRSFGHTGAANTFR